MVTSKAYLKVLLVGIIPLLLSGCATIIGGAQYNAHVIVKDKPLAKIYYKGEYKGAGSATFKVKRDDANKLELTIKQDGCSEQVIKYRTRKFRGWAFVGTIFTWTGLVNGIPVPWGVMVDLASGALWKPNVNEKGVRKENYKNFTYLVDYSTCLVSTGIEQKQITETEKNGGMDEWVDVVYFKNGTVIRGIIMEQIPNTQIKIQTKDGSMLVYTFDSIEKIAKERSK